MDVPPREKPKMNRIGDRKSTRVCCSAWGGHIARLRKADLCCKIASRKENGGDAGCGVGRRKGHLESVPVKLFVQEGGYKFAKGDVLKVSATYDNSDGGKLLRDGAMGIAVGYFCCRR